MTFDWKQPDYRAVFAKRIAMLQRLREDATLLAQVKAYYATDAGVIDFIRDWGMTYDPRNADIGLPTTVPFIPFPRQIEWMQWVLSRWRARGPGATPKSRESGVSWLAIALSCGLCLFRDGINIGFGSRKQEYVDLLGAPKSLFWKARTFLELLPPEFVGAYEAPHMRILFKDTGSSITGESGDNIGRGDRATIYFVDEAAFLERPMLAEGALSATTNCRIDISTANGIGNPFYQKVTEWDADRVFRFHWRDDPRKDEAWYADIQTKLDPVTLAQEVDINFAASVTGVLIPSAWVQSAINAHVKLGIEPTGRRRGALDVADEGADLNAFAEKIGILLANVEEWSGKGDDIFGTTARAFLICDERGLDGFDYDSDGLGAGVRGDARVLNADRDRPLQVEPFRGSGEILMPEAEDVPGRKNKDFFANRKAQEWWHLRNLFQTTHRAVTAPSVAAREDFDPDAIISISPDIAGLSKLTAELSQPTFSINLAGKIVIDKAPEGTRSPNMADAVMIACSRQTCPPMIIHQSVVDEIRAAGRKRSRF